VTCVWRGKCGAGTKNGGLAHSTLQRMKNMANSHKKGSSIKFSSKIAKKWSQHEIRSNKFA
jgi:hypothetical protein